MKKNNKVLIGITIGLIIILVFLFINNKTNKPSFIIKISGDFTSSGAQRNYNAELVFVDNTLTEGTETYYVGQGGGCTADCERTNSCKIVNGEWIDVSGKSNCNTDYPFIPATAKNGIEKQIELNELKPINKCGHLDLCYEILDLSHIDDGKPGGPGGSMGNQNN